MRKPVSFHLSGDDRQALFDELDFEITQSGDLILSILVPTQFTNLQAALKALIEDFIRNYDESTHNSLQLIPALIMPTEKRRTASALATHDMQLLCSWYKWLSTKEHGIFQNYRIA